MNTANKISKPGYAVPALDKGLDLIELLARNSRGLSLSEMAVAASRKVGEIFRVVDCLKRRGFIQLDSHTERFVLTTRLFELAHTHPPTERLLSVALPEMQSLSRDTGQSCHLAIYSAGEMLVLAQVDSPRHMGFAVHVGARVGLTTSASGRAFIAFQTDEEAARMLSIAKETPSTNQRTSTAKTYENSAMGKTRKNGYVSMPSDFIRGVNNMSYPVIDYSGAAIAALTIPFLLWEQDHIYPDMESTKARLGKAAKATSIGIGALQGS